MGFNFEEKLFKEVPPIVLKEFQEFQEALLCHFKCLEDFFQNYRFSASDLSKWSGKILIIESDDDTAVGEESSDRLRKVYPQAEHYLFHEAGHMPVLSRKKEYYSVIKKFLGI